MAAREAAKAFCIELGLSNAEFVAMLAPGVETSDDNRMLVPKVVKKKWHTFARKEHPDRDGQTFTAMNERYDIFKTWFAEHKQRGAAAEAAAETMRGEKLYDEAMAFATEAIGAYCIICDTYVTEQYSKTGSLRINAAKQMQRAQELLAAIQKENEELLALIRKEAEECESKRLQQQEHADLTLGLRSLRQSVFGQVLLDRTIPQQFDELRTRLDERERRHEIQIVKVECEARQMLGKMNGIQNEAVQLRRCLTEREHEHKDLEDNVRKMDDMTRQLRATLHKTEQDYNEGQKLLQQSSIKVTQLQADLRLQQDGVAMHFGECQRYRALIAGLEGDVNNMQQENTKMLQQSLKLQVENTDLKMQQEEAIEATFGTFAWIGKKFGMGLESSKISRRPTNLKDSVFGLQEHAKETESKLHDAQEKLSEKLARTVHLEERLKESELNLNSAKQRLVQMESVHDPVNIKEKESAAQIEKLQESHKIEVSKSKLLPTQQEKEVKNNNVVRAIQGFDEKMKLIVKVLRVAGQKLLELTGEAHDLVLGMVSTLQLESQRAKLFVTHYPTAYLEAFQNDQDLHREVKKKNLSVSVRCKSHDRLLPIHICHKFAHNRTFCAYVYVCVCVYVCACTCACACVCTCYCACVYVCIFVCRSVSVQTETVCVLCFRVCQCSQLWR